MDETNAIVTGASRGIGRAIVEKFAEHHINVWACASRENPDFEADMRQLQERHSVWIKPVYFDLREEEEIKEAVKSIRSSRQAVDILVNNAGISKVGTLSMMSMKTLRDVFECDFFGPVLFTQYIVKMMIPNKRGSIVNIGSVSGIYPDTGYIAYGSAKAAVLFASKVMAKELAPYRIRVNAVAPGLIDTGMVQYKDGALLDEIVENVWLKRKGTPEEIADLVYFLASQEASYLTGEVIKADGGRL